VLDARITILGETGHAVFCVCWHHDGCASILFLCG